MLFASSVLPVSLLSPLFSATIVMNHRHSSTSNFNTAPVFSSHLCVLFCLFFNASLYLSVPLSLRMLLFLSNWYAISWSSDIAVTLSFTHMHRAGRLCQLSAPFLYVGYKCIHLDSLNAIHKQNMAPKRGSYLRLQ